jgi:2-oxoisovalerate dehydrogenase E2 component (dihydrolipoyl transacylase)
MTTFQLPDLGEGLPDAEIVEWLVKEGDEVQKDQPLLSVETAKAVVEVPSPYAGKIIKLHGNAGDIMPVGGALIEFELPEGTAVHSSSVRNDSGTVVGSMLTTDDEIIEPTASRGAAQSNRTQALPAVRSLARRLGVDLSAVKGSGRNGLITLHDVESAAGPATRGHASTVHIGERLQGEFEQLHGARRAMSQSMTLSRDEIAMVTIFDDADISAWGDLKFVTVRLLRAMAVAVKSEPALNAVFDPAKNARRLLPQVDIGIAVDFEDKLFVPVIRDAQKKTLDELRSEVERLKTATRERTLTPDELRDSTISLSNFGTLAGRYATPLVVPPSVAILGVGSVRRDVIAVGTDVEVHPRIPLSLTFDHRCVTGGEACRYLAAVIKDLASPN